MSSRGILTVISGFSGSGKGTVVKQLVDNYGYSLSISATTRKPRNYETDGVEYFFVDKNTFENMIQNKGLLEWAKYVDNYYGTPKNYVDDCLSKGKDVILEIEVQGALKVKEICPEALLVFMTPPSAEELKRRLVERNTEDISVINDRLARATQELEYIDSYDYLVINDDLSKCIENIHSIICNEKKRVIHNSELVNYIKSDFNSFRKES